MKAALAQTGTKAIPSTQWDPAFQRPPRPGGFQRCDECWAQTNHEDRDSVPRHWDTCASVAHTVPGRAPSSVLLSAGLPAPPVLPVLDGGTSAAKRYREGGGTLSRRHKGPTGRAREAGGAGPAAPLKKPFPGEREAPFGGGNTRRENRGGHRLPRGGPFAPGGMKRPQDAPVRRPKRARYRLHATAAPRPPAFNLPPPPPPPLRHRGTADLPAERRRRRQRPGRGRTELGPARVATTAAALRDADSGSSVPPPAPVAAATGLSVRRHFVGVSAAEGFPDMGNSRPALRAWRSPRRRAGWAQRPPPAPVGAPACRHAAQACPEEWGQPQTPDAPETQALLFPSVAAPSPMDKHRFSSGQKVFPSPSDLVND